MQDETFCLYHDVIINDPINGQTNQNTDLNINFYFIVEYDY
jgi:hypothetical protein